MAAGRRSYALPLREILGRQFARAFGGGGDGAREQVLDRVLAHEDLKSGGGDPLRRGDLLPELVRRKVGARQQLAGALDRRPRKLAGKRGIEPGGAARFFETFGQQKDISRPAPRD